MERKVIGLRLQRSAANAVLTTVVDAWGQSWTPRCPGRSSGLIRWAVVGSPGLASLLKAEGRRFGKQRIVKISYQAARSGPLHPGALRHSRHTASAAKPATLIRRPYKA